MYPVGEAPLNITFCPSSRPCFFGVVTVAVVDVLAILVTGKFNVWNAPVMVVPVAVYSIVVSVFVDSVELAAFIPLLNTNWFVSSCVPVNVGALSWTS